MEKIEIKIVSEGKDDSEIKRVTKLLEKEGYSLVREYGGTLPNFSGFGAHLKKFGNDTA